MESRKEQSPRGKDGNKRFRGSVWTVLLLVCVFLLITAGVLAKYISSNRQRAEMESAQFHISSNYLEEGSAAYTLTDWGSGFDILLFNYEKENIAQISGMDMLYTVTASSDAEVSVTTQSGSTISPNGSGEYTFAKMAETKTQHTLHITPSENAGVNTEITVTVETTSPYRKTLQAVFTIRRGSKPDYSVEDQGDGTILVTVKTNEYSGSMKVEWDPAKFSPDNTNANMTSWKDESPTGTFPVSRDSTYELLFFKNTDEEYQDTQGTGMSITLE